MQRLLCDRRGRGPFQELLRLAVELLPASLVPSAGVTGSPYRCPLLCPRPCSRIPCRGRSVKATAADRALDLKRQTPPRRKHSKITRNRPSGEKPCLIPLLCDLDLPPKPVEKPPDSDYPCTSEPQAGIAGKQAPRQCANSAAAIKTREGYLWAAKP